MSVRSRPNTKNARRKALVEQFLKLHGYVAEKGVETAEIREVLIHSDKPDKNTITLIKECASKTGNGTEKVKKVLIFMLLFGILSSVLANVWFVNKRCLINASYYYKEIKRPVVNCSMCQSLTEVPIERNLSAEDFRTKYAHTSVPVVVRDATRDWTALETFSFKFFKDLYENTEWALEWVEGGCLQFMPYSTKFDSLGDFFNMSDDRANLKDGEERWYIGWMTCKESIKEVLRQHYKRPSFLPKDTESSIVDWVFMGGPGPGVPIHKDIEDRPGWQAQISGTKTWSLTPVPECEAVCTSMKVTVYKGDILALNVHDWYHTTVIEPGDISISIGSEYD